MIPTSDSENEKGVNTAPKINVFFTAQIFRPLTSTQLHVVAEVIGVCSCGGNQLIDHHNKVGGNEVKTRQTVDSSVGIRIILFKKNS